MYFYFLASLGGLLGFCTGFSLLSAVELVYWFTARILNDYLTTNKISEKSNENKEGCDCGEDDDLKKRMDKVEENETKMFEELKAIKDLLSVKI